MKYPGRPLTPRHVAIIMDGNRRWAKKRNLPEFWGHRKGVSAVRSAVDFAIRSGISYLTIFAFSTENWKRSAQEVSYLMSLFKRSINRFSKWLIENGICVRFLGDIAALRPDLFEKMKFLEDETKNGCTLNLSIAINYGSRDEVVRAANSLIRSAQNESLTWENFSKALDTRDLPDVDLLIRTSGELRLSNFLLLQSAYAELYFVDTLWPDFDQEAFELSLIEFRKRKRNFGGS